MSVFTRIQDAVDRVHAGRKELDRAMEKPEGPELDACLARAAGHFERAAQELKANGREDE